MVRLSCQYHQGRRSWALKKRRKKRKSGYYKVYCWVFFNPCCLLCMFINEKSRKQRCQSKTPQIHQFLWRMCKFCSFSGWSSLKHLQCGAALHRINLSTDAPLTKTVQNCPTRTQKILWFLQMSLVLCHSFAFSMIDPDYPYLSIHFLSYIGQETFSHWIWWDLR